MSVDVKYWADGSATGGRDGRAISPGSFELTLSTPKELGGAGEPGTNPEQLFAAGYSACFMGAMKFVAAAESVEFPKEAHVVGRVGIGPRYKGGFGLSVVLKVSLPGMGADEADALIQKADQVCPYSNALRGNVVVSILLDG